MKKFVFFILIIILGTISTASANDSMNSLAPKPLKDVFFEFNSAELNDVSKTALNENIDLLKTKPEVFVIIEGHTDYKGDNPYNIKLGLRRAEVVEKYLIEHGIDRKKLRIISYGEELPFVLGNDESAWKWAGSCDLSATFCTRCRRIALR